MSDKRQMGPAMKRTMPYVLMLDLLAVATAIGGYLATRNIVFLIAPIVVSAPVVAFLIINANRHDKRGSSAPEPRMRSIVE